jgi:hypothetical protein
MLKTQLAEPDGTLRNLRWGMWHEQVLVELVGRESLEPWNVLRDQNDWTGCYDAGIELLTAHNGEYTYTKSWVIEDPSDGEILRIEPGCTFKRWHDSFKAAPLPKAVTG